MDLPTLTISQKIAARQKDGMTWYESLGKRERERERESVGKRA